MLWCSSTVHFRAEAPSTPSSGSVAEPWYEMVSPGRAVVPPWGAVMVGVGGRLPTTTSTTSVDDAPEGTLTVSFAVNLLGVDVVYVCDGLAAVEVAPSPKSHR